MKLKRVISPGKILVGLVTCAALGFGASSYADATSAATEAGESDVLKEISPMEIETVNCLRVRQIKSLDVVGDQMVVVRGSHERYWLSRLPTRCTGANRDMYVSLDVRGSSICRNDTFSLTQRGIPSGFRTSCNFGDFESISVEQAELLKQDGPQQS